MRRTMFLSTLMIAGVLAQSADVSGRWTGEMRQQQASGDVARVALVFALQQTAGRITGTAGQAEGTGQAIRDAKLEGERLSFAVTAPRERSGEQGPTWTFDLRVSGTRMEGKAEGKYGDRLLGSTEVVMQRAK